MFNKTFKNETFINENVLDTAFNCSFLNCKFKNEQALGVNNHIHKCEGLNNIIGVKSGYYLYYEHNNSVVI